MKVLIWFLCLFAASAFINFLAIKGILLGALPTLAIWGLAIWTAKTLCKKRDEKNSQGEDGDENG